MLLVIAYSLVFDICIQCYVCLRQIFFPMRVNLTEKVRENAIIYVHGLFGFTQQFSIIHEALIDSFDAFGVSLSTDRDADVSQLQAKYNQVKGMGYSHKNIVFIGHSRGTMVINKMLEDHYSAEHDDIPVVRLAPATKNAHVLSLKKEIDHDEAGWLSYCLNHFIILPIMSLLNLFHLQAELSEDDESCAPKGHYHTIIAGNDMVVGSEDLNFLCEQTESLDHHTHMSVLIASAQPVAKAVEKILT